MREFFQLLISAFIGSAMSGAIAWALPASDENSKFVRVGERTWFVSSNSSCKVALKKESALRAWRKVLEPGASLPEPKVTQIEGRCRVEITQILPPQIAQKIGTRSACSGPNCFNSVLLPLGMNVWPRFTSSAEIEFWLSSPLCRKVKSGEPNRSGDLIRIQGWVSAIPPDAPAGTPAVKVPTLNHIYVDLGQGLAFTKNGADSSVPWELTDTHAVKKHYDAAESQFQELATPDPKCRAWTERYRCERKPAESARGTSSVASPEFVRLNAIRTRVDSIECDLSQSVLSTPWPTVLRGTFMQQMEWLREAQTNAFRELKKPGLKPDEFQAWSELYFRLGSILQQIELMIPLD